MSLFGPKSKEYGDLNRQSISEIQTTTEEVKQETEQVKEEVQVIQSEPFAGSDPGLVPESTRDTQAKFLRGDGSWATPEGGSGGTSDYDDLVNKPAIDSVTLDENSTSEDLGLAKKTDIPDTSGFITDDDLTDYAKKTDIPDVSGFLTDDDLTDYAKKTDIPSVPTKVSQLQNDSGFISSETDPTVPSWAKASSAPYARSDVYSTTEKQIGTWIDNKVIYQKTVSLTTPTTTTDGTPAREDMTLSSVGISNVDKIIDIEGFVVNDTDASSKVYRPINAASVDSNIKTQVVSVVPSSSSLKVSNTLMNFNGKTIYLTLRYTKNS